MRKGWPETTLDAAIVLNRSGYWGDEAPSDSRPCKVKVIRNADLTKSGVLRGYATRYFSDKEAKNSAFQINDVAMSSSGEVGKIWEVNAPDYFASNFVRILRPNPKLIAPGFLPLALSAESVRSALADNTVGATIQNLQKGFYSSAKFPLPPLDAQRRIVGIFGEVFDGIVSAKANAEKNLENANALYASVVEAFFNVSTSCETVELGSLIESLTDYHANGSYEVLKQHVELKDSEGFAWMVRSTDFENDFQNEMRYITKAAYEFLKKSRVFGGEIIMSKIGNAGKVYLMPEITRPCSLAMNLFLIRLNEDKASNKYVYRYADSSSQCISSPTA